MNYPSLVCQHAYMIRSTETCELFPRCHLKKKAIAEVRLQVPPPGPSVFKTGHYRVKIYKVGNSFFWNFLLQLQMEAQNEDGKKHAPIKQLFTSHFSFVAFSFCLSFLSHTLAGCWQRTECPTYEYITFF